MKLTRFLLLAVIAPILVEISNYWTSSVMALPPSEDIPEEILRTQIITVGRSPVDGKLLGAAEYAKVQAELQVYPTPKLNSQVRETVFLLRLRKILLQLFPFLDI